MCVLLDSDGLHVKESIKSTSPKQNSASIAGHIKITSRSFQKNLNMMLVSTSSCISWDTSTCCLSEPKCAIHSYKSHKCLNLGGFYQQKSAHNIRC